MSTLPGPTFAFKDIITLQFLGNLFEFFLQRNKAQPAGAPKHQITVVGATTGSSAIYGLRGKENVEVFILFPEGRVSAIQQRQMTTVLDQNIHNVAVKGTFDDCHAIVKDLFADADFKAKYHLGVVNSINFARILAQIVYCVWAYFRARVTGEVAFSVPTGNFGDILAGFYAKKLQPGRAHWQADCGYQRERHVEDTSPISSKHNFWLPQRKNAQFNAKTRIQLLHSLPAFAFTFLHVFYPPVVAFPKLAKI